jgi:hypothetical protein
VSSFIRHKFIWKFASLEALDRAATLIDIVVLVDFHIVPINKRLLKPYVTYHMLVAGANFFGEEGDSKLPISSLELLL